MKDRRPDFAQLMSMAKSHEPLSLERSALSFGFETRVLAGLEAVESGFILLFSKMLWRSAAALSPAVAGLIAWFAISHQLNLAASASTTSDLLSEIRSLVTMIRPL